MQDVAAGCGMEFHVLTISGPPRAVADEEVEQLLAAIGGITGPGIKAPVAIHAVELFRGRRLERLGPGFVGGPVLNRDAAREHQKQQRCARQQRMVSHGSWCVASV